MSDVRQSGPSAAGLRSAAAGLLAGLLLSALRAPDGTDWLFPGECAPATAFAFHLIAYGGAATIVARASRALGATLSTAALAWSAALGFAAHALLAPSDWCATTLPAALLLAASGWAANALIQPRSPSTDDFGWEPSRYSPILALSAALLAQALVCELGSLRELGVQGPAGDAVLGGTFALLVALGVGAAAPFAELRRLPRSTAHGVAAAALLATLDTRRTLRGLVEPEALESFLALPPWSLSAADIGTGAAYLVLAGRVFALPALVLGVAFALARPGRQRASLALGLALGGLAAFCSPLGGTGSVHSTRYSADGGVPEFARDGRRWTPKREDAGFERAVFARLDGADSVLLVGVLTPERLELLRAAGAEQLEVCTPFNESLPEFERALGLDPSSVTHCSPSEARARAKRGGYDAILVAGIEGAVPRFALPDLPETTRFFAWFAADGELADARWSERVEVELEGLERLRIGLTNTDGALASGARPFGSARARSVNLHEDERARRDARRVARRLEDAALDSEDAPALRALARHFDLQRESPPVESASQRVEFEEQVFETWCQGVASRAPTRFERLAIEATARLLSGKRELELIERWIAPLAERHAPWPALERVLGQAELEMLDPAAAAERFARALPGAPRDLSLRLALSRARLAAGQDALAATELEAASALFPQERAVRRELAIARVRAGDPRGVPELLALLAETPDDAELRAHAGPPPYPVLAPRLR